MKKYIIVPLILIFGMCSASNYNRYDESSDDEVEALYEYCVGFYKRLENTSDELVEVITKSINETSCQQEHHEGSFSQNLMPWFLLIDWMIPYEKSFAFQDRLLECDMVVVDISERNLDADKQYDFFDDLLYSKRIKNETHSEDYRSEDSTKGFAHNVYSTPSKVMSLLIMKDQQVIFIDIRAKNHKDIPSEIATKIIDGIGLYLDR